MRNVKIVSTLVISPSDVLYFLISLHETVNS